MRFVLYNVRYGTGTGHHFHFPLPFGGYLKQTHENLARITGFLKELRADVVGLVEVDSGSYWSGGQNQAELIARELGHYHIYHSKYAAHSLIGRLPLVNKQVNAFLSSDRIENERFHFFNNGVKRLVIELELEHLTIFLVHLSLKFSHRAYQLNDLFTLVKEVKKPCIVAGDFNAFKGQRELRLFMEALDLRNANAQGVPTYPSRAPRRELDFILYSPQIRVTQLEVPRVKFSDHLPVVCDFELLGPAPAGALNGNDTAGIP